MGLMTNLAAKTRDKVGDIGTSIHGGVDPSIRILFVFSFLVHVIIVVFGWGVLPWVPQVDTQTFYYGSIFLFIILIIWAAFVFHRHGLYDTTKQIVMFFLISAFYVLVPFLLGMVGSLGQMNLGGGWTLQFVITLVLGLFPLWPLYIGYASGMPIASKWVNAWIIILLVIFIVAVIINFGPNKIMQITGVPSTVDMGGGFKLLVNEVTKIGTTLWNKINPEAIKKRINTSNLMGSINYYTGYVDDNEQVPVGLYLRNIESDKESYEGSPAYIWADVQGKSFTQEIVFEPYCFVDEKNVGVPEPSRIFLFGSEQDRVYCKFDGLVKGSYSVKLGGKFTFSTWAYVEYTFVDQNVRRAMEIEGRNINTELDIPLRPRSVYTAGPIMLGMAPPIDQPFGIDTDYNAREPPLGITIDNLWTEGKTEKTRVFTIMVPDDFELVKCDRGEPQKTQGTGYSNYTFNVGTLGDIRENFLTINCRLHINDPDTLLGGAQKVQRTFVGMARYDYKIEKTGRIYVKE